MKEKFDILMSEYLKDASPFIDSSKNYYKKFINEVPSLLYKYFDSSKYLIKASIGTGQRSEIPWICIFNKDITTTAKQGIYLCYLFRKDMSGFYLELGQGITTFEQLYKQDKYKNINKVAEYFRNLINDEKFSRSSIDLKGSHGLAKGYEQGTIISKYYDKNNYSENELLKDLSDMKEIYDDICDNMIDESYMSIVNNVIQSVDPSFILADEASKLIESALLDASNTDELEVMTLEKVEIPIPKKKNKYFEIKRKTIKKIDYPKKAKKDIEIGLLGEDLVIDYEKSRLRNLGRSDLAELVRWVSREDDTMGYDIESYDVDENNNVRKKYIEVKSTEGSATNVFYISANEVNKLEELKEQYSIYRVFNLKTKNPYVFIINYEDFKSRIELTEFNYLASIKS